MRLQRSSSALMKPRSNIALCATSGASPTKVEKLLADVGEQRLVLEKFGRQAVHLERAVRHVALGIEIVVKGVAGRKAVDQFDAADLDQPIALIGIEPGGFGVEHDLAHALPSYPIRRPGKAATARRMP